MFVVRDCEHIDAPIERCFRLCTHLGLMADAVEMKAVVHPDSRTEGLLSAGDRVVWYGWKFGLPHVHESRVTGFTVPTLMVDTMERGRFKLFEHEYRLDEVDGHTLVIRYVRFSMHLGLAGRIVGRRIVIPHMVRLLRTQLVQLKRIAEGDEWRRYLEP